eukprot:3954570-Pyramimonas_sp.AAC.3
MGCYRTNGAHACCGIHHGFGEDLSAFLGVALNGIGMRCRSGRLEADDFLEIWPKGHPQGGAGHPQGG